MKKDESVGLFGKKIAFKWFLLLLVVFSFGVRLWRLEQPKNFYFDEVYHAFTADYYARNDPKGYEWWNPSPIEGTAFEWLHPPVSKLIMGLSIRLMGNQSFAWRFPSAVFGVLVILAIYKLAEILSNDKRLALTAAWLASFDGLLLTQSRITMNDIYVTFFMLMCVIFYWKYFVSRENNIEDKKSLLLAGLFAGLSISTKWSGVYVIGAIGTWELILLMVRFKLKLWQVLEESVVFGALPALVYVASYGQFFLQGHTWLQFKQLHMQIWGYQMGLSATHPYQSQPWQWVLNLKPVWFHVVYGEKTIGNIYALANPAIAWFGLLAMVWILYKVFMKADKVSLFVLICYLWVWLPWSFSPRIMFFYHYTPAIPFLALGIAFGLKDLWGNGKIAWRKSLSVGAFIACAALFVYFYPHWSALEMPKWWVEKYYWFDSWR